jgi:hypothetical protein
MLSWKHQHANDWTVLYQHFFATRRHQVQCPYTRCLTVSHGAFECVHTHDMHTSTGVQTLHSKKCVLLTACECKARPNAVFKFVNLLCRVGDGCIRTDGAGQRCLHNANWGIVSSAELMCCNICRHKHGATLTSGMATCHLTCAQSNAGTG